MNEFINIFFNHFLFTSVFFYLYIISTFYSFHHLFLPLLIICFIYAFMQMTGLSFKCVMVSASHPLVDCAMINFYALLPKTVALHIQLG